MLNYTFIIPCLLLVLIARETASSCCSQNSCGGSNLLLYSKAGLSNHSKTNKLFKLLEDYDSLMRPLFDEGEPTIVTCDIYINSFDSVNVDNMDFSVNIYMRQSWKDPRLSYSSLYPNTTRLTLDAKFIDNLWVPDLFFAHEKRAEQHCVTVPNRLIRIEPDGQVLYSARYTLTIACQMHLRYFPFDKQKCELQVESYGFTTDELMFAWRDIMPVQINENLELPQFQFKDFVIVDCKQSYITGQFTCLKIVFNLHREYGYYIIQNYVPSGLIVLLSWVSFWVNIDAVPARISLGVLTVLTMTTQCVGVWMSLPRVSYVKAIDIWMSTCVLFVFVAILEFATVNTLARKEIRKMSMRRARASSDEKEHTGDILKRVTEEYTYGIPKQFDPGSRMLARKVDKCSRAVFPLTFVLLNIIYWAVVLSR